MKQLLTSNSYDQEIEAIVEAGYCDTYEEAEAQRDNFLYVDAYTYYDLGVFFVEAFDIFDNAPKLCQDYFDFEKFGRDSSLNGVLTSHGYVQEI